MRLDTPDGDRIEPSRRSIAGSLFMSGYAAAALSACATPITTPEEGVLIQEALLSGAEGYRLPAYVARPRGGARRPAVVLVNEIFGIHDYIKDVCRRLAREGYVAIAPDYFDRAGDPATLTDMAAVRDIVVTATYSQVMDDTEGAIAWLKAQRFVQGDAIGVTGFCWGGAVTWMVAARFSDIKAGVAWYGQLVGPPPREGVENRPWPVDVAAQLKAPVLGLYAEQDRGIGLDQVEAMRAALAASGNLSGSEIIVYPGVTHGFHADYRASYDAEAATDGWTRLLNWFRRHGVA